MINVNEKELTTMLNKLGVPVAYMVFKKPKALPFIIYRAAGTENLIADNVVYYSRKKFAIELYYDNKDMALEAKLEEMLTAGGYVWSKDEDIYIETEHIYMTVYNI